MLFSRLKKPIVIPEATGIGQAFVEDLKKVYDRIYEREVFNQRESRNTSKLGFFTNHASKLQLIENMKTLFEKKFPKVYDRHTVDEMKTFIYTDEASHKGAGAQTGYHDDHIMALMLAFWNVAPKTEREKTMWDRINRRKERKVVKYSYT